MAVPENAQAIWTFLIQHGFNANAAAGWLGNIEQESGGNPAAGSNPPGGGLIQKLGYPTTNTLEQNMQEIITYTEQNGSIADINSHSTSPTAAATYISEHYEKPGIPDLSNRIQSAIDSAKAAASGKWPSSSNTPTTSQGGLGGLLSIPSEITSFFSDADKFVNVLMWIVNPASWLRIGAFIVGIGLLLFAAYAFVSISQGGKILPDIQPMPVPV